MPTIFEHKDLPVTEKPGAKIVTLANASMLGTNALQVQRLTLEAGAQSPMLEASEKERFVYVIRGEGQAHIEDEFLPLAAESLLWLDKGDTFSLEAGADGLEVLLCQAPAGE